MNGLVTSWFWLLLALVPYGLLETRFIITLQALPAKLGYHPGGQAGWNGYIRRRAAASIMGALCWLVCVLALSGAVRFPRYISEPVLGAEITFVIDASNSMLTDDGNGSRLESARSFASRIAAAVDGAALSVVAFRGGAVTLCPSTLDRRAFEDALRWAGPVVTTAAGSDIGVAMDEALNSTPPSGTVRILVVLGDGNDTGTSARAAAIRASEAGLKTVFVGFGGDGLAAVVNAAGIPVVDEEGKPVQTRQEVSALRELAAASDGVFVRADNPESYSLVAGLCIEASSAIGKKRNVRIDADAGPILALVALLAMGATVILSSSPTTRTGGRPRFRKEAADA